MVEPSSGGCVVPTLLVVTLLGLIALFGVQTSQLIVPALGEIGSAVGGSSVVATPPSEPVPAIAPMRCPSYPVRPGDTLSAIALGFGVTIEELAEANNLPRTQTPQEGSTLIVPIPGCVPNGAVEDAPPPG
jgi:LysM repeat protein